MNAPDFIVSYVFCSQMSLQVKGLVSMWSVLVVNAWLGYSRSALITSDNHWLGHINLRQFYTNLHCNNYCKPYGIPPTLLCILPYSETIVMLAWNLSWHTTTCRYIWIKKTSGCVRRIHNGLLWVSYIHNGFMWVSYKHNGMSSIKSNMKYNHQHQVFTKIIILYFTNFTHGVLQYFVRLTYMHKQETQFRNISVWTCHVNIQHATLSDNINILQISASLIEDTLQTDVN